LLSYEEITEVAREAVGMGFDKIRLTGGEPLVRSSVVDLVKMLSPIEGLEDLAMTTNGVLLDKFAVPLVKAGLHRVNISLDSVDPERYHEATQGDLTRVLAGIRAAKEAGFKKIKLNCVVDKSSDEEDARGVAAFAAEQGLEVRFIRRMNLAVGEYWPVEGGIGGRCEVCNRLRLSSDGQIRPCLFSDAGYGVRELGAREAILRAIKTKPESGKRCYTTSFRRIGG
jgi:cyclic pyranopterin phosphate synthase